MKDENVSMYREICISTYLFNYTEQSESLTTENSASKLINDRQKTSKHINENTAAQNVRVKRQCMYIAMLKRRSISYTRLINVHSVGRFVATVNRFLFSSTEVIALKGISL